MITDPIAVANLVTRTVQTGTRDGAATRLVIAARTYETDQKDLWDLLTNRHRISRWFLPVSGELRHGGRYQLEGGTEGTIEGCDAPNHFSATWEIGGSLSWISVSLAAAPEGTRLTLTHEAEVEPEFWNEFGPSATGIGWDLSLMTAGVYLETGEAVDPEESADFTLSSGGKTFVQTAADDWAAAAVRDGDDAPSAARAADNAVAFYTELPE